MEYQLIEPKLESDLEAIEKWLETNSCNTSKVCYMTVGSRQNVIEAKDMTLNVYDKPPKKETATKLREFTLMRLCLGIIRYPLS